MRILRARLLAAAQEEADAAAGEARRSQVRTVDRSERIRTYNFPENRISDHRTGYKAYNLDQVLDGDLQPVVDSCVETDLASAHGSPRAVNAPEGSARGDLVADRRRPAARQRGSRAPEHDASELLAFVLGVPRGRARRSSTTSTPAQAERVRRAGRRGGRCACRSSTSPASPTSGTSSSRSAPASSCPRPETELLAGWAVEQAGAPIDGAGRRRPGHRLGSDGQGGRARGAGRTGARRRARRGRPCLGGPQPGRHRRRPASGRPRRRLRRPGRHGRRGGQQPAVHPARGVGVGRGRGARPRPRAGALRDRRRARHGPRRRAPGGPAAAARGRGRASSTPTSRASPRRPSSPPPGAGTRCATTRT